MLFSLEGRLRKTSVPVSRPLLPVFEAIANSVHSIQQAKRQDGAITVTFRRADTLLEEKSAGAIESVEIRDNGAGFTPKNYEAFQTADTTFKLDKGGKGVGRFTWLVAFSKAKIESRHGAGDCWRAFEFSPEAGIQLVDACDPSSLSAPGTVLTLVDFKSPWRERCPASLELIAADIIEHFIAMFVSATCPKITVIDDSGNIELRSEFARAYDRDLKRSQFKVGDDAFDITSLRLRRGHVGRSHRLLYLADDREVKTESLTKHLQGLPTPLNDEQGSFFFVSFVQGRVLDRCVDPGRSSFQIPDDDESANASLFRVLTWRDLRAGAVEVARVELAEWLDRIFEDKRRRIEAFVAQQEPHYQVLLRDVTEIAADLPPVPSSADIDRAMSRRLFERRERLKVESSRLLSDLEAAEQADPDAYREKMNKAVQEFNELGMADLSRYVCHRRVIIDFLEKALQIQPSSGRYGREDAIHSLIYPMRKTSMDVEFFSHNLWLNRRTPRLQLAAVLRSSAESCRYRRYKKRKRT